MCVCVCAESCYGMPCIHSCRYLLMFGLKTQTNKNPFSFSILSSVNLILKHGGGGHSQMPFAVKCLPDTFIVASTDILVGNRYKLCKLTSKLFSLKIRSLKNFYITFIIVYMPWHTCGGQRTICGRLVTSSTLCVSGIQLRTSGLAQATLLTETSCQLQIH